MKSLSSLFQTQILIATLLWAYNIKAIIAMATESNIKWNTYPLHKIGWGFFVLFFVWALGMHFFSAAMIYRSKELPVLQTYELFCHICSAAT